MLAVSWYIWCVFSIRFKHNIFNEKSSILPFFIFNMDNLHFLFLSFCHSAILPVNKAGICAESRVKKRGTISSSTEWKIEILLLHGTTILRDPVVFSSAIWLTVKNTSVCVLGVYHTLPFHWLRKNGHDVSSESELKLLFNDLKKKKTLILVKVELNAIWGISNYKYMHYISTCIFMSRTKKFLHSILVILVERWEARKTTERNKENPANCESSLMQFSRKLLKNNKNFGNFANFFITWINVLGQPNANEFDIRRAGK